MYRALLALVPALALADSHLVDLAPGEWRVLQPAPDPVYGIPRGRSWTPKMAYAPDLGGAFLAGAGIHGHVGPTGLYQDDLWFYDAGANTWTTIHPGSEVATLALELNGDGIEVDPVTRDPVPVAVLAHAYNLLTYDTDRGRFMMIYTDDPYWHLSMPQRFDWLPEGSTSFTAGRPYRAPWIYDPPSGRWSRPLPPPVPEIDASRFEGVLEYMPGRGALFVRFGWLWLYDVAANSWAEIPGDRTAAPYGGYDVVECYDAARGLMYMGKVDRFAVYDVAASGWTTLNADAPIGSGNSATLTCDASGRVLLTSYLRGAESAHVYDPAADQWSQVATPPVTGVYRPVFNAFYDPAQGVHFLHAAGDSMPDGVVLGYRMGAGTPPATVAPVNMRTP